MTCPKCGGENPEGAPECKRCGVLFARVHAAPPPSAPQPPAAPAPASTPGRSAVVPSVLVAVLLFGGAAALQRTRAARSEEPPTEPAAPAAVAAKPASPKSSEIPEIPFASSPSVRSVSGAATEQPVEPVAPYPTLPPQPVSSGWYEGAAGYARGEREKADARAPMVVYFFTDWCKYCKALDQEIADSPEIQRFLATAVKVRVNPETGDEEQRLADRYGVRGYPAFFVVPAGSTSPRKVPHYTEPDRFVKACESAAAG